MSARKRTPRKRKSFNINEGSFNEQTPRTLIQNVMKEQTVQQTVRKKTSTIRRRSSRLDALKKPLTRSSVLDTTITPRTALENVMNANDVMRTIARPSRPAKVQKSSNARTVNDKVFKRTVDMDKIYHPVSSQQEFKARLDEKIFGLKKANASSVIVDNISTVSNNEKSPETQDEHDGSLNEVVEEPPVASPSSSTSRRSDPKLVGDDNSVKHHQIADDDVEDRNDGLSLHESSHLVAEASSPAPPGESPMDTQPDSSFSFQGGLGETPLVVTSGTTYEASTSPIGSVVQSELIPASEIEAEEAADPLRLHTLHGGLGDIAGENNVEAAEEADTDEDGENIEVVEEEQEAVDTGGAGHADGVSPPDDQAVPTPFVRLPAPSMKRPTTGRVAKKQRPKSSSIIPRAQLRGILQHFSTLKVERDAVGAAEGIFDSFFRRLCVDMEAVAGFGGRKTVTREDMELVMRRQRFITKDKTLNMLIREHLPMEYQELLIDVAHSAALPGEGPG